MNRFLACFLLVVVAAQAATVQKKSKSPEDVLQSYYNMYQALKKDEGYPNTFNRANLLAHLKQSDPEAFASLTLEFAKRTGRSDSETLETVFRGMAEEQGYTEDDLKSTLKKMIAAGKFPDLEGLALE
ncbi:uncharacterized protein LOC108683466 [Hyalella azteca]|uniref:Uncharacterized protein LOC108683466 n=1 Tax=Hyalella azteca TaxID=294128 RepID=A0A8B7PPX9_HYAAZ|nr:uncharacterized protein LOC108683466 [Hyalella azteca]